MKLKLAYSLATSAATRVPAPVPTDCTEKRSCPTQADGSHKARKARKAPTDDGDAAAKTPKVHLGGDKAPAPKTPTKVHVGGNKVHPSKTPTGGATAKVRKTTSDETPTARKKTPTAREKTARETPTDDDNAPEARETLNAVSPAKKQKRALTTFHPLMTPSECARYMEKALRPVDTFLYLVEPLTDADGKPCASYGKILTINIDLVEVLWVFFQPKGAKGVVEELYDSTVNTDCRDLLRKAKKGKWHHIARQEQLPSEVREFFDKRTK